MWIWYEEKPERGITLLRLYGSMPVVSLPEKIDGRPVTDLAPYAFSEKERIPDPECCRLAWVEETGASSSADRGRFESERSAGLITPLAGDFIREVRLPDALERIHDLCFYQCRKLKKLSFGSGEVEIGSDAFMNCRELAEIELRAASDQPTSLRRILSQRTSETDVWFDDAVVHFPEYQEKYDLIGPAHIFELNIEGEGFRARKCFEGEVFSLPMYDEVFRLAADKDRARMERRENPPSLTASGYMAEESVGEGTEDERTMCRMAALRLCRPASLDEKYADMYRDYLLLHGEAFIDEQIRQRDLSVFLELRKQGVLKKELITLCLKKMTAERWIEGTRAVLAAGD